MKKLGVVVGRFQTDVITDGQLKLIECAQKNSERVLIVIGQSRSRLSFTNPLPFEARKIMLVNSALLDLSKTSIVKLMDEKYDEMWSNNLDNLIIEELKGENISNATIYGGRDSFKKSYHGKAEVVEVSFGIDHISATDVRKQIHSEIGDSKSWRSGVIFASAHRYPVSYQTVDIAVVNFGKMEALLGKRSNEQKYRFVGGHVDPTDDSLEEASKRECTEECGNIETDNYKYVGSYRIDDWRHRKEKDKILTAFFCCNYIFGKPKAKDDIDELKWFDLTKVTIDDVEPEHHILLGSLKKYLTKTDH